MVVMTNPTKRQRPTKNHLPSSGTRPNKPVRKKHKMASTAARRRNTGRAGGLSPFDIVGLAVLVPVPCPGGWNRIDLSATVHLVLIFPGKPGRHEPDTPRGAPPGCPGLREYAAPGGGPRRSSPARPRAIPGPQRLRPRRRRRHDVVRSPGVMVPWLRCGPATIS